MISACSLRRRISKKWLIVILVCCILDSLVILLYYHRTRAASSLGILSQHQQEERGESSSRGRKQESSRSPSPSPPPPSPLPPSPPTPRKEEPKESKPKIDVEQNVNYVENILSKMEKSMEKDKVKLDPKLPKPLEMLKNLEGPVERRPARQRTAQTKSVKLLVVAREHSGFPVLGQFLTEENDFFVHGEPPGLSDLETVPNLLNCVLSPSLVQNFSALLSTEFGQSPYFRRHCLQGSGTVCSDPLSYETFCSSFPHQLIRVRHSALNTTRQIMRENKDIKVIFLVRDPRGTLRDSGLAPASVCSDLARDWEEALSLVSDFPTQFSLARYETLAVAPQAELDNLLKSLRLPTFLRAVNVENNYDEDEWNPKKNSIVRVNSWKTGLTNKELKSIENVCVETLSKMEYQLLSAQ